MLLELLFLSEEEFELNEKLLMCCILFEETSRLIEHNEGFFIDACLSSDGLLATVLDVQNRDGDVDKLILLLLFVAIAALL